MVKLKNIIITENSIEADYYPEDSDDFAHISIDLAGEVKTIEHIEEYSLTYTVHALQGLKRILENYKNNCEIPKVYTVMWY